MNWKIWVWVPMLYGLFSLWYFNWQGPLTEEEIEQVMQVFDGQKETANTSKALFRKFLEEDDGGEFVMLNMRNKPRLEATLIEGGMPADLAKEEVPLIDKTMRQSILKLYRSAVGLRFSGDWVSDLANLPSPGQLFWGETDPFVDLSVAESVDAHASLLHSRLLDDRFLDADPATADDTNRAAASPRDAAL